MQRAPIYSLNRFPWSCVQASLLHYSRMETRSERFSKKSVQPQGNKELLYPCETVQISYSPRWRFASISPIQTSTWPVQPESTTPTKQAGWHTHSFVLSWIHSKIDKALGLHVLTAETMTSATEAPFHATLQRTTCWCNGWTLSFAKVVTNQLSR